MKRGCLPQFLCLALFFLILVWRMIGAPITSEDWSGLHTSFGQARALLPARMARMAMLWPLTGAVRMEPASGAPSLLNSDTDPEDALLKKLVQQSAPESPQMTLAVFDAQTGQIVPMPMESYVCSVVAAEMPASYHLEALKAQAVAARTRVYAQSLAMGGGGCSQHPNADVCTDSAHCQGYASVADCREKWSGEYEVYRQRVAQAVTETQGQIITYQGRPIEVFYHAISGGTTEDVQSVFSESLPYLVSVDSKGEEGMRGYSTDASFTFEQAAELLGKAFPKDELTAQVLRDSFTIGSYTPTGRVDTLFLGNHEVKAAEIRKALNLRSTWFTVSMDPDRITFHQRGYGHGVGMSQAGANAMAADGSAYPAILAHYYQGTEVAFITR